MQRVGEHGVVGRQELCPDFQDLFGRHQGLGKVADLEVKVANRVEDQSSLEALGDAHSLEHRERDVGILWQISVPTLFEHEPG